MAGYIIEARIQAKDNEALNRSAVAEADIAGGTLVTMGAYADGRFTVTASSSGQGKWMAYNPSEHFVKVNGILIPQPTADPRAYVNLTGRTFDVFYPVKGDLITFTDGNIKSADISSVEKGKFLEQGSTGLEVKSSATASTTSFKVIDIYKIPFPQAGIGDEFANAYICECVNN